MLMVRDRIWCRVCMQYKDPNTELYLACGSENEGDVACLNCHNVVGQTTDKEWKEYWER